MYELIARLLTLLHTELVVNERVFRSVQIMDRPTLRVMLRSAHLPALIIIPFQEWHEQGPFANTARINFKISLLIVATSVDMNAYRTEPISGTNSNTNAYLMTDKIRAILYNNKRLIDSTFEMKPTFSVTDQLWSSDQGQLNIREVSLEYANLELYTGMQNDQDTLSLSEGEYTF